MKIKIWKAAISSFIISFLLLLFRMDRVISTTDVNGMTSGAIMNYQEYFFKIISYSIVISFLAVLLVITLYRFKKNKA